ncbi:MAG: hypothetical protein J4F32_01140, partial [Dehalococcoidia bacterium]|nr:hypothetical protein [Dehalococcoidia bacterium]
GYFAAACIAAGILALPMHTNASIIYIYLGIFAIWQRHRLTRRDWGIAAGALTAGGLAGLAVLLAPDPALLFELLDLFSDRAGAIVVITELQRWGRLAWPINFDPTFTLSVFFGVTGIAAAATLRPSMAEVRAFSSRYAGILIVGLAAFIGLALLPSASWTQYIAYYLPTLTLLAALAYAQRPSSRLTTAACAAAIIAATGALIVGIRLRWGDGLDALTFAVLTYSMLLAAILCAAWLTRMRVLLACACIVAVGTSTALSAERSLSFHSSIEGYRQIAREFDVDTIYSHKRFGWVFNDNSSYKPLARLLEHPMHISRGIAVLTRRNMRYTSDSASYWSLLTEWPCSLTEVARHNIRVLPLAEGLSQRELIAWLFECDSAASSYNSPAAAVRAASNRGPGHTPRASVAAPVMARARLAAAP